MTVVKGVLVGEYGEKGWRFLRRGPLYWVWPPAAAQRKSAAARGQFPPREVRLR